VPYAHVTNGSSSGKSVRTSLMTASTTHGTDESCIPPGFPTLALVQRTCQARPVGRVACCVLLPMHTSLRAASRTTHASNRARPAATMALSRAVAASRLLHHSARSAAATSAQGPAAASAALAALMSEHVALRTACDALDVFVAGGCVSKAAPQGGGGGGSCGDRAELSRFARVFREYGDVYHHAKEEDILFPAMTEGGLSLDMGPLGVMLADHERGRMHVGALAEAGAGAGPLSDGDRAAARVHGARFTALLREHMAKEDRILYPMALRLVPAAAMARVEVACAAVPQPPGLRELVAELAARWGAPPSVP
jgi:hemerythrin-like domain-containing protein